MKKAGLLLVLLIFIIPFALAQETNYTEIGDVEGDFKRGQAIFGQAGSNPSTTGTKVVNFNKKWNPLAADLDGDGDTEYIIMDGDTLRIFENPTLDIVVNYGIIINHQTISGSETYSNIITFDIDDDGKLEIIYVKEKNAFLDIIEFNESGIFAQEQINISALSSVNSDDRPTDISQYAIKCQDVNKCIMTYANEDISGNVGGGTRQKTWYASYFNSSFVGHETEVLNAGLGFQILCHPRTRSMAIADYDNDGKDEIIETMLRGERSLDESMAIFWYEILDNGTIEHEATYLEGEMDETFVSSGGDVQVSCDGTALGTTLLGGGSVSNIDAVFLPDNLFTAPISFEFTGSSGDGTETMVAFIKEADGSDWDFMIKSYTGCPSDLGFETSCAITELDDYPETCDTLDNCGTAHLLTNIFRANALPDTTAGDVDVCASGIVFEDGAEGTEDEIDTICGSNQKTVSIFFFDSQTTEYTMQQSVNTDVPFNVTGNSVGNLHNINNVWHSLQTSDEKTNSIDLSEVSTPYGILKMVDGGTLSPDWEIFFANPQDAEGIMISVDGELQNSEDLLLYTGSNLFYIDDGLINQPAIISFWDFNPCPVDTILKINETMIIDVKVTDQNTAPLSQDRVNANVTIYNDDENEQTQSFNSTLSGALLRSTFTLNKTITNGEIELTGWDDVNPEDIDTITFTLNVQENGLEFDDVTCSETITLVDVNITDILNISAEAEANEGLRNFFEDSSNAFSVSPLIVALFLMLGWTIAVLTTNDKANSSMITMNKVIFMLVGNIFIFIMASIVGAIPFGVMLVIIILAIFSVVFWARKQFTANQTG